MINLLSRKNFLKIIFILVLPFLQACNKKEEVGGAANSCDNYQEETSSISSNSISLYTVTQKVQNRPTIPVFYPWSGTGTGIYGTCGDGNNNVWFDCDNETTPYSLLWTSKGRPSNVETLNININDDQKKLMTEDNNTLYLISDQWHYYSSVWSSLSTCSKFYLNEVFKEHEGSEYDRNYMINIQHPDWPELLAKKAQVYKNQGFDGILFDWWHNYAGNCKHNVCVRSPAEVEVIREAIAKKIRSQVGDNFIIMGNVNWNINDPAAKYMSGAFLELWKQQTESYPVDNQTSTMSIEAMEGVLKYWDNNLMSPKIVAFEPWKITVDTSNPFNDRSNDNNTKYAKLYTAMGLVIPENGYILYADNNPDWSGGDHQHHYFDFWKTDFGKPVDNMTTVKAGVGYKNFEKGFVAYNRTSSSETFSLDNGTQITLGALEGLFLSK